MMFPSFALLTAMTFVPTPASLNQLLTNGAVLVVFLSFVCT